ncbi:MAG: hypothetical protein F083_2319 [bacterium F083]|nr:MAG: hypothetical protein AUK64_1353 [bacterium P201]KWW38245.1 MAG: hypothetical protein F083_2319 [bacterium F083]
MRKHVGSIAWLLGLVVMVACTPSVKVPEDTRRAEGPSLELSAIDSLMWRQPDSALTVLMNYFDDDSRDGVHTVSTDETFDNHYANLLLAELLFKNYAFQTNRTQLLEAVSYFDSLVRPASPFKGAEGIKKDLTPNPVFLDARAHYINGVGYYEHDSVVEACKEYLKALEVMEEHFEEKNLDDEKKQFIAYTHTRLTDLFSDLYLHEQALYFGKRALEYYRSNAAQNHIAWMLNEIGSHYDMMGKYDSAIFYYRKSLEFLPDTFNLTYRDIQTRLAYMSYKKDGFDTHTMNLLYNLLSQGESEKEYLSRCLAIGEIYYLEHQFDSAWIYFDTVFERTNSDSSKKLAAKRLLEICKIKNNDSIVSNFAACLAQFATKSERQGAQNSALTELYRQYGQNKAERALAINKNKEITTFVNWLVLIAAVIIALIIVFTNSVRRRNKELLKQKQMAEKRLESESYSNQMKQKAYSGRLKKSNEELRLQKEEVEKLHKALETSRAKTQWNHLDDVMNEDICKEIVALLSGKNIKRDAKSDAFPELHLDITQLSRLDVAIEKNFAGFGKILTDSFPKITHDEMMQCQLYLLNLEDVQIAALLSCDYSTVKKRSLKLKKAFHTEKELRLFIRELVL